ncbi:MAG: hypothetical protein E3J72_08740 [Planctomycetota bacterium]|nr:MAG: hypothetical protein E3J72_08740 [Planctomycetota bacterium]
MSDVPSVPDPTLLTRFKVILGEISEEVSDLILRLLYNEYARRTEEVDFEPGDVTAGERSEATAALCEELDVTYNPETTELELDSIVSANLGRTLVALWNWLVEATPHDEEEHWKARTVSEAAHFLSSFSPGVRAQFLYAFPPEETTGILDRFPKQERITVFRELGKVEAYYGTDAERLKQIYDLLVIDEPTLAASRGIQDVFDQLERLDRKLIGRLSKLAAMFGQVLEVSPGRAKRVLEVLNNTEVVTMASGCSRTLRRVLLSETPVERISTVRKELCEIGPTDIGTAASARLLVVEALRRLSKKSQFWGYVRGERIVGCPKCGRTFAVPVARKRVVAKCPHCDETRIIKPIRKTEQLMIPRIDSGKGARPAIKNVTTDELDGYIRDVEIDLKLIRRQERLKKSAPSQQREQETALRDLFETFAINMKDLFFIHLSKKLNMVVENVRQDTFESFVLPNRSGTKIYIMADPVHGAKFLLDLDPPVVSALLSVLRERIKDGFLIESSPERRVFHYFLDIFNRALKTIEPRNRRFDFRMAAFYDSITKVGEFRPNEQVTEVTFTAGPAGEAGTMRAIFPDHLLHGFTFPSGS